MEMALFPFPSRSTAYVLAAALAGAAASGPSSAAEQGLSLIRDAEVENIIRAYAAPLFKAAGYGTDEIKIHIIADKSLNAFVAEGLNMFFHTGLLVRAEQPDQVMGVIAHELGHITGGHLARREDALRVARGQTWAAVVLGAAAAIATGRGDAAAAVVSGGAQLTTTAAASP